MANESYLKTLRKSVKRWNTWRKKEAKKAAHPDLSNADLGQAGLAGANLAGTILKDAYLVGADLSGADLRGAQLGQANLLGANLSNADLRGADLAFARLAYANLDGAKLDGANLNAASAERSGDIMTWYDTDEPVPAVSGPAEPEADLISVLVRGAEPWNQLREGRDDLKFPDLIAADLSGIRLAGAKLQGSVLAGAKLTGADLTKADLSRGEFENATLIGTDLTQADLSDAHFGDAEMAGAVMERCVALKCGFRYARLERAKLRGAVLTGTDLRDSNLNHSDLSSADLSGANLQGASLIEANVKGAKFDGARIYGASAWALKGTPKSELNLIITPDGVPSVAVDNLEVAQFMYLLLDHKKLRDTLNTVMERGVLLLGRFGDGGLEQLEYIACALREHSYLPIIFDFDRPKSRTYTETVKTLVGLSRFVIVDLSGPSVPAELTATVPHFKVPFIPIMERGRHQYSMFVDLLENDWVLEIVEFDDLKDLESRMQAEVIDPAEDKARDRQRRLAELYAGSSG